MGIEEEGGWWRGTGSVGKEEEDGGEEEQEIRKWEGRWNVNRNLDEIKYGNNLS